MTPTFQPLSAYMDCGRAPTDECPIDPLQCATHRPNPELPGKLSVLEAKPGDRFVLHYPERLSLAATKALRASWQDFWGADAPLLMIVDSGATLGIIRRAVDG